jgi:hypothetical protein
MARMGGKPELLVAHDDYAQAFAFGGLGLAFVCGGTMTRTLLNPKGIASSSPGLRVPRRSAAETGGTSYPGKIVEEFTTPTGL